MSEEAKKEKKNKKINKMNLDEINTALEETKKNQGGFLSHYADELQKRKEFLTSKK